MNIKANLTEVTIAKLTLLTDQLKCANKSDALAIAVEIAQLVVNAVQQGKTVVIHDGDSMTKILLPGFK